MVTVDILAPGRLMFSKHNSFPAIFEKLSTVGKNSLVIVKKRAVPIQAPIFLAKKLQSIYEYMPRSQYIWTEKCGGAHHARNQILAVL